jgi:tetrahydromethanopterin S-methyltransferase subunit F
VGIVVGVVVAIVIVGALAGFAFIFFRRRQRAEMDEFKKNSDITSFVGSGSTMVDPNRPQMWAPDQRLDTGTTSNRISNGSIADNQDYSRRILQVSANIASLLSSYLTTLRSAIQMVSKYKSITILEHHFSTSSSFRLGLQYTVI